MKEKIKKFGLGPMASRITNPAQLKIISAHRSSLIENRLTSGAVISPKTFPPKARTS